ncbi:MAG: 2,3,4,5-tetrahydropyridine-2,6-dicarboxylate N-acetyltransferase [Synergistetes bacterium]|nr:2,3,4,5-tetrahydropyridine-2,6-dicarboxylate N-acetyltransferase [Synergistota bacterium]
MSDAEELIRLIKESKKKTPTKAWISGSISPDTVPEGVKLFGVDGFFFLVGDYEAIQGVIKDNKNRVEDYWFEISARNSALPLLDYKDIPARIEPGAIIRGKVKIGRNCVIMMGAVINVGAEIGEETMIDMNAVIGGRVIIGKKVHVGAGAVIAGVIEPPSATPVVIEDGVLIGANAVVLEGVRVGKGSVVGAGAVVVKDVPSGVVVAGVPAKVVKQIGSLKEEKRKIVDDLRGV